MSKLDNLLQSQGLDFDFEPTSAPSPPARGSSSRPERRERNARKLSSSTRSRSSATTLTAESNTFNSLNYIVAALNLVNIIKDEEKDSGPLTAAKDIPDEMLLQLDVEEALFTSSNYRMEDSEVITTCKKQLQDFVQKINSLCNKLSLEQKVKEAALNLTKLSGGSESEMNTNQDQLIKSNAKIENVCAQIMDTTSSILLLERRILKHTCAVLRHRVSTASTARVPPSRSQRSSGTAAIADLTKKLETAETRIKELDQINDVLKRNVTNMEQLEKDYASAKQKLADVTIQRDGHAKTIRSLEASLRKDARKSKSEQPTASEYNRLKLELATTRADLAQVKEDFAASRENTLNMELRLEEEQRSLEMKNRTIANMRSEMEELETQLAMQQDSSGDPSFIKSKMEKIGNFLKGENSNDEMQERLKQVTQERDQLLNELQLARSANLQQTRTSSIRQSRTLPAPPPPVAENDDSDTEDEGSSRRRRPVPRKPVNLNDPSIPPPSSQQVELHGKLELLQMEITESTTKESFNADNFISIVRNLLREKDALSRDMSALKAQLEQSTNEINVKSEKLLSLERALNTSSKDRDARAGEFENLKTRVDELQRELESTKNALEESRNSHQSDTEKHGKSIEALNQLNEHELAEVKEQLSRSEDAHSKTKKALSALEANSQSLTATVNDLQSKLKQSTAVANALQGDVNKLESQVSSLQAELAAAREANARSEGASQETESEVESVLLQEIEKLQLQLVALKTEKAEMMSANDDLQHEVEVLHRDMSKAQKELEKATATVNEHNAKEEKLQETIRKLEEKVKEAGGVVESDKPASKGWFGYGGS